MTVDVRASLYAPRLIPRALKSDCENYISYLTEHNLNGKISIQGFTPMSIFTLFFTRGANMDSQFQPYTIYEVSICTYRQ